MLCYHNVHVSKNRGTFSRFPEHHWIALSMIYAFYPTTFFQLGVYSYVTNFHIFTFIPWTCQEKPQLRDVLPWHGRLLTIVPEIKELAVEFL